MANWNNPTLTSSYTNFVTEVKGRDDDAARQFDPAHTSPTNVPTNTIRYNGSAARWERWNGTAWNALASAYAISITGNAGTATALQTARNINGVSFDGTANITLPTVNTSGAQTIAGVKTFSNNAVFNGDVGIGTSSPATRLTVTRTSAAANPIGSVNNSAIRLQTTAAEFNEKAEIQFQAGTAAANAGEVIAAISSLYTGFGGVNDHAGALLFSTRQSTAAGGLTERMRITSAGNVGIGADSPQVRLHVTRADGGTIARFAGASYAARIQSIASVGTLLESTNATEATYQPMLLGGSQIQFTTTGTERMRIDSAGNVGIGTTTPQTYSGFGTGLTISGSSSTATRGFLEIRNFANTVRSALEATTVNCIIGTSTEHPISFITNGTERARLLATGQFRVGSSDSRGTSVISTSALGFGVGAGEAAGQYRQIYWENSVGALYFTNGTNQATLNNVGSWINASDARLKKNIRPIKYGLETVMAVQPRSYEHVDAEGDYIGFVAQEILEHVPEVVEGSEATQYGVNYGALVSIAFKAIQEQQAQIEQLRAEIQALKGN